MIRRLLFCLMLVACTADFALARQESPESTKSNVHEFESADEMVGWFDSMVDSNSGANILSKNATGDIQSIALMNPTATDGNIGLLSQFGSLRHLRIKCANRISTEGFRELSKLHALEHLELGLVCGKLPNDFWEILAELPKLKKIDLVYLELPENEMAGVENLSALESISFRNVTGMTQDSCEQMTALDGLRILKISRTTLRPSDLSPLDRIGNKCNVLVEFNRNAR